MVPAPIGWKPLAGTLGPAMPGGHYFDAEPAAASRPATVELRLPDGPVELVSDRGVFSASRVDPGTAALLRAVAPDPTDGDLLDLGCGYGPITVALARRNPAASVWALDVNARARELVARNAARLGLGNIRPVGAGDVPEGLRFAQVWSNPPVRIGKPALHELLGHWLARLADGGQAWLVVQRHLGADSLSAWLGAEGWAVRRVASKAGYRVLEVRRPS